MFVPFLYELRKRRIPVGTTEAIALSKALAAGLHDSSLDGFYYVARALLVHDEGHLDAFDDAFLAYFKGVESKGIELRKELLDWLAEAKERKDLTPEEMKMLQQLDLNELRQLFEQTLADQKERHDGGKKWVGTAGESRFGNSGAPSEGVRVGGAGGNRSAVQVAAQRRYQGYRSDLTLDVRQMGLALKRLRQFVREGAEEELDLDGTIAQTANNAGELEVVTRPENRPNTRVLLLMDVGGSMDPFAQLMSRMFTAAKKATHFKELRCYYFHNCIYGRVYKSERFDEPVLVTDLLHECGKETKLIVVGDALMAPYELLQQGGAISYNDRNTLAGIGWLAMLQDHFRRSIWLNPEPQAYWGGSTIEYVQQVFDMFPLTLEGLTQGMQHLTKGRGSRRV